MEDPFDLFSEPTAEELEAYERREEDIRLASGNRIALLSPDPNQRSLADNRLVFRYHQSDFNEPGIQPSVLTQEECQAILTILSGCSAWTTARHSAFATTDIPIRSNPQLAYVESMVKQRLLPTLARYYGFKLSDLDFRDIFVVKYEAKEGGQRGLDLHSDAGLFSLTLLLSHPDDFEGGGTYFQSIDRVVRLGQGDCSYHEARVMHSGVDITKGTRFVLVAFIDTVDTIANDNNMKALD